jgi:hypothetical protein
MVDEMRDSLLTRAEIEAGPVCERCGRKCGMSKEDYDVVMDRHVRLLADTIDAEIIRRVQIEIGR